MGLISWFVNKVTQEQVRLIALETEKVVLRQNFLEEEFKKLRAYVGYKPRKKTETYSEDADDLSKEEREFLHSTIEFKQQQERERLNNSESES